MIKLSIFCILLLLILVGCSDSDGITSNVVYDELDDGGCSIDMEESWCEGKEICVKSYESCFPYEISKNKCVNGGGRYNPSSNKCKLDNVGSFNVPCDSRKEALCECDPNNGLTCPEGYACLINNINGAVGYCMKF